MSQSFFQLVRSGDREGCRQALKAGVRQAFLDEAWLGAASYGHYEIMDLLLSHGACLEARDGNGRTALHVAVSRLDSKQCAWLLEHGADVNARNYDQEAPLHRAARVSGSLSRFLISHGAEVHAKSCRGETPLHLATINGCMSAARALLAAGAEMNEPRKGDRTVQQNNS